jgi:hypothetical protein
MQEERQVQLLSKLNREEREKFLRAAIALRGNENFEVIREEIKRRYAAICERFHGVGPDAELRKEQGRADALLTLATDLDPDFAFIELEVRKKPSSPVSPNLI